MSEFTRQVPQSGTPKKKYVSGLTRVFASLMIAGGLALSLPSVQVDAADAGTALQTAKKSSDCSPVGSIWWNELLAPETSELQEFYARVVGWKRKVVDVEGQKPPAASPEDRYTIFMSGKKQIAGLMNDRHPDAISPRSMGWFVYVQVADVDEAVEAAEEEGGTILEEPIEVAGGHSVAVIRDPLGNIFGMVTPSNACDTSEKE